MKLYYAATSPYVRKVMACAITRGLEGRIQLHPPIRTPRPPIWWLTIRPRKCHAWSPMMDCRCTTVR